jgi:hypothetical protein
MNKNIIKMAGAGLLAGLSLLGFASPANAYDGPTTGPQYSASSSEGDGVLTGNSAAAAVAVPVDVCGNGVGVGVIGGIGGGLGVCDVSVMSHEDVQNPTTGPQAAQSSASGDGVAAGNSGALTWATPVRVCGNGVGVGGGVGGGIGGGICEVDFLSAEH